MILETDRLILEKIKIEHANFYFELFNDPDWIKFISDKALKTVEQTRLYLQNDFIPNYCTNGLGYFTVFEKESNMFVGVSTILKREDLDVPDIGYGFLPIGRGKGYAFEASKQIVKYVKEYLGFSSVYAITKPNNIASRKLLKKLEFNYLGDKSILSNTNSLFKLNL